MTDQAPAPKQEAPPPAPSSGDGLLDWVVQQYLGSKVQAKHIMNYNGANMAFNHGRDIAKKLGLDPELISPFPAKPTTNVQLQQTPTPLWKQVAIGASLLAGGAGAATVASSFLSDKPQVVVPAPVDKQPSLDSSVGFTVE